MRSFTATILATLASGAPASDVYCGFFDADYKQIGGTQYDVSNTHCFYNAGATQLEFSQASTNKIAAGPYCLSAFSDPDCNNFVANQEFSGVQLDGKDYPLKAVAGQQYWRWDPNQCPQ